MCEQCYIDIGDTCSRVYNTELQHNIPYSKCNACNMHVT